MISRKSIRSAVAAALAATLLAACGGSDYTPPAAAPPPPSDGLTQMQREDRDASATVPGLLALANAMLASLTGESSEPRAIDGITPPTSESAEPSATP
jgi:predicted small lipoprotein YifL